jgi:proline iminopeptidase
MNSAKRAFPWLVSLSILVLATITPALAAPENGKTFEASGATIYYEVFGTASALPLIVVNGGPGFDHTYLHQSTAWTALQNHRQIVFYDQRGTGRSLGDHKGQTFTLKDQIADLEALRAHLGYERIDLMGHSWGGFLVMAYAATHPDRIAHLTIVDSMSPKGFKDTIFLFDDVYPETTERQASVAFPSTMGDQASAATDLREYASMLFYSPEKRDAFMREFSPSVYNKDVNRAVSADLEQFDLTPEIRKFRFPVLVITGRFDMNVAPLVAYRIHQAIPNSKFTAFERSGHIPFYEEPDAFAATLESFLGQK